MKSIYSKSRKLFLVIFLGLYYCTIEKFTIFIVTNDIVTTILLSTIFIPFATSKYINIGNNNNGTNNNNIDLTISLFTNQIGKNSTLINEKYYKNIRNSSNKRNSSRYKRKIWNDSNNDSISITGRNDFLIKNENIKANENYLSDQTNYYYEEQKPLIILPSESGPIAIPDYSGTVKPLTQSNISWTDSNKYILTTSTTESPTGISDLSSSEMNEYDDNYQNNQNDDDDADDYNREKYNDEMENDNDSYNSRPNISSYMETAKNIWDIFTAINTAWSAISEKQQNDNQNSRKFHENSTESTTTYYQQENNYNDGYINDDSERSKRNTNYTNSKFFYKSSELDDMKTDIQSSTDVPIAEGRYIKGDPLKGYYDFVITEGSYKFWAAFQFATAILIIYSTFAAIYYSKVNPLVGDYDYVDYLGGGRSLSNDDDTDFIDIPYSESRPKSSLSLSSSYDNNNNINSKSFLSTVVETAGNSGKWLPRMGHTLKFILDAIDKIPQ